MFIEYVNVAAVVWLTFYIGTTAIIINSSDGRPVAMVNPIPLVISITALATLAIATIKVLL